MAPSDIPEGPLAQSQAKSADENGTLDLISTNDGALKEGRLTDEQLSRTFEKWWPDLLEKLRNRRDSPVPTPQRQVDDGRGAPVHGSRASLQARGNQK